MHTSSGISLNSSKYRYCFNNEHGSSKSHVLSEIRHDTYNTKVYVFLDFRARRYSPRAPDKTNLFKEMSIKNRLKKNFVF